MSPALAGGESAPQEGGEDGLRLAYSSLPVKTGKVRGKKEGTVFFASLGNGTKRPDSRLTSSLRRRTAMFALRADVSTEKRKGGTLHELGYDRRKMETVEG